MKRPVLTFLLSLFFLTILSGVALPEAQTQSPDQHDQSLRKGETRETLDPAQFDDSRIRKAYQAAKDIPWVLDSIYCFCFCHESPAFKHTSLLSCYVDLHAAR